jgi:hypothetical protein
VVTTGEGPADAGTTRSGEGARGPSWELGEGTLALGTGVRVLLWDYARGSLAYDLALALIALAVLLVPGSFWGDPLWRP